MHFFVKWFLMWQSRTVTIMQRISFQLINGEWKLSPLMTCCRVEGSTDFTTTINNNGDPTHDDVMAVAKEPDWIGNGLKKRGRGEYTGQRGLSLSFLLRLIPKVIFLNLKDFAHFAMCRHTGAF